MNTNYHTSKNLSPDNYNKLSSESIMQLYKMLKTYIPFSPCRCILTYNENNTIHSGDISTLPQNFFAPSTAYFVLDFLSDNYDFITITLTHTNISLSSSLPYDYQSTKDISENIFKELIPQKPTKNKCSRNRAKIKEHFTRYAKIIAFLAGIATIISAVFTIIQFFRP